MVRVGFRSDLLLEPELDELLPIGGDVVNIFHSYVEDTSKTIPVVKSRWCGVHPGPQRTVAEKHVARVRV